MGNGVNDCISRQAAIDIGRNATVDTNPSHFEAHQKFTQFMDDEEVSSFGRWQWSNGFNTALTAVGIDLKKLPSAHSDVPDTNVGDMISRQAAMEMLMAQNVIMDGSEYHNGFNAGVNRAQEIIRNLSPVQPNHNAEVSKMEIIHCKDCKHWNLQVGNVKGDGLGSCDFHNVNLVTGEGFCYWADKRGDSE